jgi:amidase
MALSNPQSSVTELSIADIHARFAQGLLTCTELTQRLLQRIERYDKQGPGLNALITVNPHALDTARHKDREYGSNPAAVGPLHGIPVIVKDNYNTADLPTTGGSVILAHARPPQDCFVVQQLRQAGALILAKANLTELAMGGTTLSSFGGQTRNPYDVLRTPGGSSGGTAAAITANFGILGTGSDTGQSTRSPASATNLVGIRPTRGLVSRSGILPISSTQDEAGPLTRSVADAARMLAVMAGYDPDDPITAFGQRQKPHSYVSSLDRDGLRGARIGLLTDLMGTEAIHEEVNGAVHNAVQLMEHLGATVLPIAMPHLTILTTDVAMGSFEFREAFNRYLARVGPDAPVKNLAEFLADGRFR